MNERCERCAARGPAAYTPSPLPRVGGFWLCPDCRAAWLAVLNAPSFDTVAPALEEAAMSPRIQVVWSRTQR